MKRTFSLLLAMMLVVASIGFAPAVLADEAGAEVDVKAAGIGKLSAQGDGIAVLSGKGIIDLSGNGILWVKDLNGDAKIEVSGYGSTKQFADGWIQYSGVRGNANIKGSNVRVIIAGVNIDLQARGRGKALLWGHGTYTINGKPGQWENNYFGKFLTVGL